MRVALNAQSQSGAVLAIVALSLFGLMGMVVIVVDVGALLTLRRRLVTASDSAALAAAQSCALPQQAVEALTQADRYAQENVPGAERLAFLPEGCGLPSGRVTVEYRATQRLFFAPVLGEDESENVSAKAKALWGPAGGADPIPLLVNKSELTGSLCGVPVVAIGQRCAFWYDDDTLGKSQWGFMDFRQWNVSGGASCSGAGSDLIDDWIRQGYGRPLALNHPSATYVCAIKGSRNTQWETSLPTRIGHVVNFPVNDQDTQVDSSGSPAPPPNTPHKYNIVGFVPLKIVELIRGDDPRATGILPVEGDCSKTGDVPYLGRIQLDAFGCYSPPADISNLQVFRSTKGNNVVFTAGVDYVFDRVLREVTWLRHDGIGITVSFHWTKPGSLGACGMRAADSNAWCLVTEWTGYRTGGANPNQGQNFGLEAIRLYE